eukprot:TRINITY_DN2171_c0_g1::TRINITY_DN2171_c0_g1_i2::g.12795::m.12795 TRINITY_DN2171_c0_g1::TRINITY_DN2171_c0_g1_i2::g.12795  ORF type:complete len:367 (-),score=151.70,sp/Q6P8Y1/CAPSL_MOUSE/39.29/1e-40,EF-hand_7/PF13499.1/3.7e-07,EF-hand_7/PF13499.1/7.2e-08,EF-hand_6/PF13405.1/0.0019,EF-hand_6/PF13405.1/0.00028,EF-hand_6/PF13405.1/0.13,EF-hand_6/PF13405.1/0.44,EF-hand_1/PF00036.27/0.0014,EF-hand_1/PF00036.27/2.1e-05,EF-hand_1/PF00036.27/0.062,EF-hand_1/PF00036.27/5.4,EF-hand_1/PF00036.27/4.6e+03,EF-h
MATDFATFKLSLLETIAAAKDVNGLVAALQTPAGKQAAFNSATPAGGNASFEGNKAGDSRTLQNAPAVSSVQANLEKLRESLAKHGARGICGLGKKFKIIDDDGSNQISFPEFKKCIGEHSLGFSEQDLRELFKFFDEDCSGEIGYDEFLTGIRGVMNEHRQKFVNMAFDILDKDKSGFLELCDIVGVYDASKHPDVIGGKRSASEVLREFLDTFDGGEKDGRVTREEFHKYYSNVSASIDRDDYFELMMRNAWHISGGEGAAANTTNRRVLVTHADGRQSVEEIKNDIGISKDNTSAMQANLRQQGVNATKMEMHYANDDTKAPTGTPRTPSRRHGAGASSITFG